MSSPAPAAQPASDIRALCYYDDCYREVVRLFRSAQERILMGAWVLDFHYRFDGELTFLELIAETCARGVQVDILLSDNFFYPYVVPRPLPEGCRLRHVANYGHRMPRITRWFMNRFIAVNPDIPYNGCLNGYHQKYLAVDARELMVGGVDINAQRSGDLRSGQTNPDGYIWHEVAVRCPCSPDAWAFLEANFETRAAAVCEADGCVGAFDGANTENDVLVDLIEESRRSLYIENQHFVAMSHTRHGVARALLDRLERAIDHGERYQVVVLTNRSQLDSGSKVSRLLSGLQTYNTVFYIEEYFRRRGVSPERLARHLFVGSVDGGEVPIFMHSKLMIQDAKRAVVSSSNLSDRSLVDGLCDREFGVLLEDDPAIARMERDLMRLHVGGEVEGDDFSAYFEAMKRGEGHVQPVFPNGVRSRRVRALSQKVFDGIVGLHDGVFH